MDWTGIFLIVILVGAALVFGIFKLNQWAAVKMSDQEAQIEGTKQSATIFIIDKKEDKMKNAKLSKSIMDQIPKLQANMKVQLVQAKVGPTIMTLIADKNVYDQLPLKKNVKVEISGIYIVSMQGMKSKTEMKEIKKAAKRKSKNK